MKSQKQKVVLQVVNIVGYITMIAVNALANIIPFNGYTTGEVSSLYPNLFTPANITFAIWGLIYLLLGGFVVYQARDIFRRKKIQMDFLQDIGWYFFISSLANSCWIISWHFLKISLSLLIMFVLLLSLIIIYLKINKYRKKMDIKELIFVHLPFSIYLSWIAIATLANITVFFVDNNVFNYIPEIPWVIAAILLGTTAAIIILLKKRDIPYSLVTIWALTGIVLKRLAEETILSIIIACFMGIVLIISTIIYILLKPYQKREI